MISQNRSNWRNLKPVRLHASLVRYALNAPSELKASIRSSMGLRDFSTLMNTSDAMRDTNSASLLSASIPPCGVIIAIIFARSFLGVESRHMMP